MWDLPSSSHLRGGKRVLGCGQDKEKALGWSVSHKCPRTGHCGSLPPNSGATKHINCLVALCAMAKSTFCPWHFEMLPSLTLLPGAPWHSLVYIHCPLAVNRYIYFFPSDFKAPHPDPSWCVTVGQLLHRSSTTKSPGVDILPSILMQCFPGSSSKRNPLSGARTRFTPVLPWCFSGSFLHPRTEAAENRTGWRLGPPPPQQADLGLTWSFKFILWILQEQNTYSVSNRIFDFHPWGPEAAWMLFFPP